EHPGGDVVTVQTIHKAKGLEYPIVVLADVNTSRFPSSNTGANRAITYRDPIGLRARKIHQAHDGHTYAWDNWRTWFLERCVPSTDYDEERRLLYVAMTRAQHHLILTAETGRASPFFEQLPLDPMAATPTPEPWEVDPDQVPAPLQLGPVEARDHPRPISVGALVGDVPVSGGRGKDFGQELHTFAARLALGEALTPKNQDQRHVAAFMKKLEGPLQAEVACAMPLTLHGDRYVVEGKIDLLAGQGGELHVVDWKSVPAGEGLEGYALQVGLYAAIVQAAHPEAQVTGWIVYTPEGEAREVAPLTPQDVEALVEDVLLTD
ncbi:MAG: 3'-5' exonuclease, partial [Candidatus Thermoplasmatota archaeon]|nr:3'-5' exonuclease [Candidatus Thermoplasmatota archaeon]